VEREHRSVLSLFAGQPFEPDVDVMLDDDAAHHARVRRATRGAPVRLLNGAGAIASGAILSIDKRGVLVKLHEIKRVAPPSALDVIVPVADRDRMLIAAEKCVELQVTAWRPASFARSRSVGTRGEGEKFREKVAARMRSALEQSGGAWLPVIHPEVDAEHALQASSEASRFLLDASGAALVAQRIDKGAALAVGPEGGFERSELELAASQGWTIASLGPTTLRFETAIIAGAAVIRAAQFRPGRT
jgi:16S rRNA (uracil1498-N3)-methyltransferase